MFPRRRDYSARWQLSYNRPPSIRAPGALLLLLGTTVGSEGGSSTPAGSAQGCGQISSKISETASTASDGQDAARRCAAARHPIWVASGAIAGHWVRPELVVEVTYLTWTDDGLLRQVVYEGLREDKPARGIARSFAATETVAAGRKF